MHLGWDACRDVSGLPFIERRPLLPESRVVAFDFHGVLVQRFVPQNKAAYKECDGSPDQSQIALILAAG